MRARRGPAAAPASENERKKDRQASREEQAAPSLPSRGRGSDQREAAREARLAMHQSDNERGEGWAGRAILAAALAPAAAAAAAAEDDPIRDEESQKPIKGDDEGATCTARQNNRGGHDLPWIDRKVRICLRRYELTPSSYLALSQSG